MASAAFKRMTSEEYLARERLATEKSEFYDGDMFAMSGGTAVHSLIASNLILEFGRRLEAGPCRVFSSDMRVKTGSGLYTYPDISIVCQPPSFENEQKDVLTNPLVILEVLSPSTEAYDRGKKFEHYRTMPSLMEFILVSQDRHVVEHFARQSMLDGWLLTAVVSLESERSLPILGITIPLVSVP